MLKRPGDKLIVEVFSIKIHSIIFLEYQQFELQYLDEFWNEIKWSLSLVCIKSAQFSLPVLILYLCSVIRLSRHLPVWPTYILLHALQGIL